MALAAALIRSVVDVLGSCGQGVGVVVDPIDQALVLIAELRELGPQSVVLVEHGVKRTIKLGDSRLGIAHAQSYHTDHKPESLTL